MRRMGCAAVVVRPDRYVFGAAADAAALNRMVAALAEHVLGKHQPCSNARIAAP